MSSSIDERIIKMIMDTSQFEHASKTALSLLEKINDTAGVKASKTALDVLAESLNKIDVSKAIDGISNGINSVNFNGLNSAIDDVNGHFSLLGRIGEEALGRIASTAVNVGETIVKNLAIDPVSSGFDEYGLLMDSTQVILANTGRDLEDVKNTLEELNHYADKTIYNFAQMTTNIGKFTAAGVGLEESTTAIKGLSNLSALVGVNAEANARAMYNLSQALSVGKMQTVDWKSFENTGGLAGKIFRDELIATAQALGYFDREWEDATGHAISGADLLAEAQQMFRNTLSYGWLDNDVMIQTLAKFADETTELGQRALKAATEVRTFSKMWDALKEAAQSGWSQSYQYIFGDYEEGTNFWTAINDEVSKYINGMADARNAMLEFWHDNGGREALIKGLSNVYDKVKVIQVAIKQGITDNNLWAALSPEDRGATITRLSEQFKSWSENLTISALDYNTIYRLAKLLVSPMNAITAILTNDDIMGNIGKGLRNILSSIEFIVHALTDAIFDKLNFEPVVSIISYLARSFEAVTHLASEFFNLLFNTGDLKRTFENFLTPITTLIDILGKVQLGKYFGIIYLAIYNITRMIISAGDVIGKLFEGVNTDEVASFLNNIIDKIYNFAQTVFTAVRTIHGSVMGLFGHPRIKKIISGLADSFTSAMTIFDKLGMTFKIISEDISNQIGHWGEHGFWKGIENLLSPIRLLLDYIGEIDPTLVIEPFEEIFSFIIRLATKVEDTIGGFVKAFQKAFSVADTFNTAFINALYFDEEGNLIEVGISRINSALDSVSNGVAVITRCLDTLFNVLGDIFDKTESAEFIVKLLDDIGAIFNHVVGFLDEFNSSGKLYETLHGLLKPVEVILDLLHNTDFSPIINGVMQIYDMVLQIAYAVGSAIEGFFNKGEVKALEGVLQGIVNFIGDIVTQVYDLVMSPWGFNVIKGIASYILAKLQIAFDVIAQVADFLAPIVSKYLTPILEVIGGVTNYVDEIYVSIEKTLRKNELIKKSLKVIKNFLKPIFKLFGDIGESIKTSLENLLGFKFPSFDDLKDLSSIFGDTSKKIEEIGEEYGKTLDKMSKKAKKYGKRISKSLKKEGETLADIFSGDPREWVPKLAEHIASGFKAVWEKLTGVVKPLFSSLFSSDSETGEDSPFVSKIKKFLDTAKEVLLGGYDWLKEWFVKDLDYIKTNFGPATEWIKDNLGKAVKALAGMIKPVANWFIKMFSPAFDTVKEKLKPITDFFTNIFSNAGSATGEVTGFGQVVDWILDKVNKIKEEFKKIPDFFNSIFGGNVADFLAEKVTAGWERVKGAFSYLPDIQAKIEEFVNSIVGFFQGDPSENIAEVFDSLISTITEKLGELKDLLLKIPEFIASIFSPVEVEAATLYDEPEKAADEQIKTGNGIIESIKKQGASLAEKYNFIAIINEQIAEFQAWYQKKLEETDSLLGKWTGIFGDADKPFSEKFKEFMSLADSFFSGEVYEGVDAGGLLDLFEKIIGLAALNKIRKTLKPIQDMINGILFPKASSGTSDAGMPGYQKEKKEGWIERWTKGTKIGDFFSSLSTSIKTFTETINKSWPDAIKGLQKDLLLIAKGMRSALTDTGKGLKKYLSGKGMKEACEGVLMLAAAIAIIAGSMYALAQVPTDQLVPAAVIIGVVLFALGMIASSIAKYGGRKKTDWISKSITDLTPEIESLQEAASKFLKYAKVGVIIFALGMAISTLVSGITKLGDMKFTSFIQGLVGVAAALGLFVGACTFLLGSIDALAGPTKSTIIAMIVMIFAIGSLANAVVKIGQLDVGKIWSAGIVLAGLMAVFGYVEQMSSHTITADALSIIALGGAIWLIATSVKKLGKMKLENLIKGGVAVGALMLILTALEEASTSVIGGKQVVGLALMALIVAGLSYLLTYLSNNIKHPKKYKKIADSLAEVVGALAGLMVGIGVAAKLCSGPGTLGGGMKAILILIVAVAALTTLVGLIGGIVNIFDKQGEGGQATEAFKKGIKVLKMVGRAIGQFFGEIVGTFIKVGLIDPIFTLSDALERFGEAVKNFSESIKGVKSSKFKGLSTLASVVLDLTGKNVLTNLGKFLPGDNPYTNFQQALQELLPAVTDFCKEMEGIKVGNANKVAGIIKDLVTASNDISQAGLINGSLFGQGDFGTFAEDLVQFVPTFNSLITTLGTLNFYDGQTEIIPDDAIKIESIDKALDYLEQLLEISKKIPHNYGILPTLGLNNQFWQFGADLALFAPLFKSFLTSLGQLNFVDGENCPEVILANVVNTTSLDKALEYLSQVIDISSRIPENYGLLPSIIGNNRLKDFGEDLALFAPDFKTFVIGMSNFSWSKEDAPSKKIIENQVNVPNLEKALGYLERVIAIAETVPTTMVGVDQLIHGDNNIASFGIQLQSFSVQFKLFLGTLGSINFTPEDGEFNPEKGQVDPDSITKALEYLDQITGIANSIPERGNAIQRFISGEMTLSEYGTELGKFAEGLTGYLTILGGIKFDQEEGLKDGDIVIKTEQVETITGLVTKIGDLAGTIEGKAGLLEKVFSGDSSISGIGKGIGDFADGISTFGTKLGKADWDSIDLGKQFIEDFCTIFSADTISNLENLSAISFSEAVSDFSSLSVIVGQIGDNVKKSMDSIQKGIVTWNDKLKNIDWIALGKGVGFTRDFIGSFTQEDVNKLTDMSGLDFNQVLLNIASFAITLSTTFTQYVQDEDLLQDVRESSEVLGVAIFEGAGNGLDKISSSGTDDVSIKSFVDSLLNSLNTLLGITNDGHSSKFHIIGENCAYGYGDGVADSSDDVISTLKDEAEKWVTELSSKSQDTMDSEETTIVDLIKEKGESIISELKNSVVKAFGTYETDMTDEAESTFNTLVTTCANTIQSEESYNTFYNAASYLADGFINAINARTNDAATAVGNFANAAAGALAVGLDEHSPSRISYKDGRNFLLGFVNAVKDNSDNAVQEVKRSFVQPLLSLTEAMQDESEYTPTIRPVVDMTDINASRASIQDLFSSKSVQLAEATMRLADDGNRERERQRRAAIYNDKHVVSAISGFKTDFEKLNETIQGLGFYMDGDTLVGTIAKRMDKSLGVNKIRRGRSI